MFTLLLSLAGCHDMPVGYLQTENAAFSPNVITAYRTLAEGDVHLTGVPWTSLRIQGISGTNPINYDFSSVKAENGGDAAKFEEAVTSGDVVVNGGIVQIYQTGINKIPNGTYILSLRVYNEGYSQILTDILTFIISEKK